MKGFQRLFSLGSQTLAIFQIATLPSPLDGDRTETLAKDFGPFQSNYNPTMKLYLHHLLLAAVLATSPSISAGEPVSLLSGNLTDHWTTTGNWSLEDGIASLTPREGEKGWARWSAYLWSTKQYGDFEIEFDYRVQEKGNSGFYFRVGDKDDPVKQGIEVQILIPGAGPRKSRSTTTTAAASSPASRRPNAPPNWQANGTISKSRPKPISSPSFLMVKS